MVQRLDELALDELAMTSTVAKKTSKLSCPLRSLARASFIVLNVVTSTLQLYFLPKEFRQPG